MKIIIVTLSLMFSVQLYADGQVHGVSFTPDELGDKLVYAVEYNEQEERIQKMIEFNGIQLQHDRQGEYIINLRECMEAFMVNEDIAKDICIITEKN